MTPQVKNVLIVALVAIVALLSFALVLVLKQGERRRIDGPPDVPGAVPPSVPNGFYIDRFGAKKESSDGPKSDPPHDPSPTE